MNRKFIILAAFFLTAVSSLVSASYLECTSKDWTLASHEARDAQAPILVVFTAQGCGYCEKLKQEVLLPTFAEDRENRLAVVREVDINAGGKMTDFNGERIRSRQFKKRYQIYATPTLLVLDAGGKVLDQPIVGYDSKQEYLVRLQSLLEKAHLEMQDSALLEQSIASKH